MINPGTLPIEESREDLATVNLKAFLAAARTRAAELEQAQLRHRTASLTGDPVRNPTGDRDGWYGWDLPLTDGSTVQLLVPGVPLERARDDLTSLAPCFYVNGLAWWWNDAVSRVAAEGIMMSSPSGGTASAGEATPPRRPCAREHLRARLWRTSAEPRLVASSAMTA